MNRARIYMNGVWAFIGASLIISFWGCAAGPRAASEHDLNLSRANSASANTASSESAPTPSQTYAPPVVLRSGAETADFSYATGCYHAYERICGKLLTDQQRGACRDDGLSVCEEYGHKFGEWIRSGAGSARK